MEKEIVNQVQEAQRVPCRINPRRNTPRHVHNQTNKDLEEFKNKRTETNKLLYLKIL